MLFVIFGMVVACMYGMKTFKTIVEAQNYLDSLDGTVIERSRKWYGAVVELPCNGGFIIEIMTPKRARYNQDPLTIK